MNKETPTGARKKVCPTTRLNPPIILQEYTGNGLLEMSVQASQHHYCGYGTKEVRIYGITRCPYGWAKYMETWNTGECYNTETNQVFGHVPDEIILKYAVSKNIELDELNKLKYIFAQHKIEYDKRIRKLTGLDKLDELYNSVR